MPQHDIQPDLQADSDNADLWKMRYQLGDTGWDKGESHPALPAVLDQRWLTGSILVPGCGRGYDVQTIAGFGHACVPTGIDIAPSAIATAKERREFPNATYQVANIFTLADEQTHRYDAIWEHTCFCALHPEQRSQYVESAAQLLVPDGHLVGIFYLSTKDQGNGPPFKIALDVLRDTITPSFEILEESSPSATYPGREGEEILIQARRK